MFFELQSLAFTNYVIHKGIDPLEKWEELTTGDPEKSA